MSAAAYWCSATERVAQVSGRTPQRLEGGGYLANRAALPRGIGHCGSGRRGHGTRQHEREGRAEGEEKGGLQGRCIRAG